MMILYRIRNGLKYYSPKAAQVLRLSLKSRELGTFTYKLTSINQEFLLQNVSIITRLPYAQIKTFCDEITNNERLIDYAKKKIHNSQFRTIKDERCDFGSRIAYYCIVRALKLKTVVENGVELGYTGLILCEALLKNKEEGYPGDYYGFDIDPSAGLLINEPPYSETGRIITGESLDTLKAFSLPIDFYFSDGGRTPEYEKNEFNVLQEKIAKNSIVVSNKLGFSDALSQLSIKLNRNHIYFREEPLNHWYPGSHIGIMF